KLPKLVQTGCKKLQGIRIYRVNMIAPEGIRDGQHFAKALYTFNGEGGEDLPFQKDDMIEVLDCADANWWRGKNLSTDEDGLFPACLVKFT
ncbi:hypothetical protein EV175_003952, partial [Coemansia sp. RSA 1933]